MQLHVVGHGCERDLRHQPFPPHVRAPGVRRGRRRRNARRRCGGDSWTYIKQNVGSLADLSQQATSYKDAPWSGREFREARA
eukprot:127204-Chlamydomonas_euryale.AAC.1